MIIRYEVIAYAATLLAAGTLVTVATEWPLAAALLVAVVVAFLGLLLKLLLEEAIGAEELNKIHAMEAVVTSSLSLQESFARTERLAPRLRVWGLLRRDREQDPRPLRAPRGASS